MTIPLRVQGGALRDCVLEFAAVSKSYQGQPVLQALDLAIGRGEFLTLLGPSGCGKTTSLNLVAGLLQPDSGTIFLRGKPANTLSPQRRGLGLVFQSWALFPHMTVFDNVGYGLKIRGVAAAESKRRVGAMLDLVRLPHAADRFPSQLSGGMQQRVALARALVTGPDLLLLDEPLSNLDAALRKEMQIEIRRIHGELGISTLLVTHSQEEALVMSDRIAVMRQGRIACIGTPDHVYNHPPTEFVCSFLGDASILECRVERRDDTGVHLVCGTLRMTIGQECGIATGQTLTVAIRPERIELREASSEAGVAAVVQDAVFRGSNIAYRVLAGTQELQVLTLPSRDGGRFARGEPVRVVLHPSAVIPLRADA